MQARTDRSMTGAGEPMSTVASPVISAQVVPAAIAHSGGALRLVKRAVSCEIVTAGTGCQLPLTASAKSKVVAPPARAMEADSVPPAIVRPVTGVHGADNEAASDPVNSSCPVMVPDTVPLISGADP